MNSYISECKAVGQDSQAISGFNGPGNYLIENNYLEGATENVLFGGADPTIPNLVTSNITFRRNYLSKPLAWRDPIIATPAARRGDGDRPAAARSPAGTYFYKVVARVAAGQNEQSELRRVRRSVGGDRRRNDGWRDHLVDAGGRRRRLPRLRPRDRRGEHVLEDDRRRSSPTPAPPAPPARR